jgi:hypothetical protein
MTVVARIYPSGDFHIAKDLYTVEPDFQDTEDVDDAYEPDDAYDLEDTDGAEVFLSYLFDITATTAAITSFSITHDGKLLTPAVYEIEPSYESTDDVDDAYEPDDAYDLEDTDGIETLITYLFDIAKTDTALDKFYITNTGEVATTELHQNAL